MRRTVGDAVDLRRSKKWTDERARAEDLLGYAEAFRAQNRENLWRQSERQYSGNHWAVDADSPDFTDDDMHRITVNMSFSTINTIVPYVTGEEPSFYIEPGLAPANKRSATILQTWLNRTWRSNKVRGQEHLEISAFDSLQYGDGWFQVFWEFEDDEYREEGGITPARRAKVWIESISPWDVFVDPWANGLQDARYVFVRNRMSVQEAKENPSFSYTADLSEGAGDSASDHERPAHYETSHEVDQIVDVYEMYDLIQRRLLVFVKGHDMPLKVVENIEAPLVHLKNYRIPSSPYGMSELEQIWPLQQELNETRSQMITHRKRNVAKYLARRNALSNDATEALKSEAIGEIVFVDTNQDFDEVVKPLEMAQMSADPYQVSDIVTRDIYEISGVNEYLRGATPTTGRTATEASIIETASNIKSTYKLRQIEKFVRKAGQLMLDTAADVFPETDLNEFRMVLTGRDAQQHAREEGEANPELAVEGELILDRDTFQGEYEVHVETGSTEMRNPRFREEKYKDMVMTLVQVAPLLQQLQQPVPNIAKVVELWLEASGIEDLESILGPDVTSQLPPGMDMQQPPGQNPQGTQPGQPMMGNVAPPAAPLSEQNTNAIPPSA